MCLDLVNLCNNLINLSPSEKQILCTLCIRANQNKECYSSIERLMLDSGSSKKTVERTLKKLRDKKFIKYTGKNKGALNCTPVYCIDLRHGQFGGDLKKVTDNLSKAYGQFGGIGNGQNGYIERSYNDDSKDNKEKFSFSEGQMKRWEKERAILKEKLK